MAFSEGFDEGEGVVGGAGVDDDDFGRRLGLGCEGLEEGEDVVLFVEGGDDYRRFHLER